MKTKPERVYPSEPHLRWRLLEDIAIRFHDAHTSARRGHFSTARDEIDGALLAIKHMEDLYGQSD